MQLLFLRSCFCCGRTCFVVARMPPTRLSKSVGRQGNWAAAAPLRARGVRPACRPLCLSCGAASCPAKSVTCTKKPLLGTDQTLRVAGDGAQGQGRALADESTCIATSVPACPFSEGCAAFSAAIAGDVMSRVSLRCSLCPATVPGLSPGQTHAWHACSGGLSRTERCELTVAAPLLPVAMACTAPESDRLVTVDPWCNVELQALQDHRIAWLPSCNPADMNEGMTTPPRA